MIWERPGMAGEREREPAASLFKQGEQLRKKVSFDHRLISWMSREFAVTFDPRIQSAQPSNVTKIKCSTTGFGRFTAEQMVGFKRRADMRICLQFIAL